jgi:hypothetical protein
MKKRYFPFFLIFCLAHVKAQTPFQRVYTILNTKCQNTSCHSSASTGDNLKFDGTSTDVYNSIFNSSSALFPTTSDKFEKLVKPQHPYYSFLLRKIAGKDFDLDLAIDSITEGSLMKDISGSALTNKEIEFIRQWIMFGAKKTYSTGDAQPDWQVVSDYYDTPSFSFLPHPPKPAPGAGIQLRMGPIFLPATGETEQEWLQLQEINFPTVPEVYEIDGYMNQQSHHFLLFRYADSTAAFSSGSDGDNMAKVSMTTFTTSFDGDKFLTGAWQDDKEMILPQGTALMWDQKTFLDLNYHVKNYTGTAVLPCDFYFNVLYRQRNPNTIPMLSHLINNALLVIPPGVHSFDYDDGDNSLNIKQTRYLWTTAGHTHQKGTGFDIYVRDTTGQITDKIYDGTYDYEHSVATGVWDWQHPPVEVWPALYPVRFGRHNGNKSGLVCRATYDVDQYTFFSFQTTGEMQLFSYNYTLQPIGGATAINDDSKKGIYFEVMPNPMNDKGKLVYMLEQPSKVEASVLDITGKTVAQLSEELEEEGVHEINIGSGEKLSSGIYFARLSINGTMYTRKFIITE